MRAGKSYMTTPMRLLFKNGAADHDKLCDLKCTRMFLDVSQVDGRLIATQNANCKYGTGHRKARQSEETQMLCIGQLEGI
jgi:hypothetical protein